MNIGIYLYPKNDTNEYPNKYLDQKYSNIWIYSSHSGLSWYGGYKLKPASWKLDPMGYIWLLSTISGCFQTESWPSTLTARLPAVTLMDANEYEISQILPIFKWIDSDSKVLRSERFWSFSFCWQQWWHCYFVDTEHSYCCFTFSSRFCSFGGCKFELESRILENIFQRRIKSPFA